LTYQELKNPGNTTETEKLLLRHGDDYLHSCYSSEVKFEAGNNYKSINYLVKSTQGVKGNGEYIHVLIEYRLRWKVDQDDNFI